ncbi:MAG: DUF1217 domain-containing protein [Acetobacteraceae bacterium]|nr:DUF1217 domain-containing protein [Acetobacteraceae bacterium]
MNDPSAAIAAFRRATADGAEARALERLSREPQQRRAMEQFRRAVERAPDAEAALRDPRVLTVLAVALGIPEAAGQAGLARRALLADPNERDGLLARLPDGRWREAAASLSLKRRGVATLRDPAVQARLAEGLQRAAWQRELDAAHPGLGDAVLFSERAPGIRSTFGVLGNPVLRRVVTGALDLPPQLALQGVEAQARAVESRLDVARLKQPAAAQRLAERYLIARAREAQPPQPGALPGLPPARPGTLPAAGVVA